MLQNAKLLTLASARRLGLFSLMLGSQWRQQRLFILQIEDDRQRIAAITNRPARHFCYPGGLYLAEFPEWLPECGVPSATITKPALATRKTSPYLLPRLIDTASSPQPSPPGG